MSSTATRLIYELDSCKADPEKNVYELDRYQADPEMVYELDSCKADPEIDVYELDSTRLIQKWSMNSTARRLIQKRICYEADPEK